MARFEDSIDYVLAHEGGYTDHPADPGGATFFGISLRFLKSTGTDIDGDGDVDAFDVSAMTKEKAKALYKSEFWDKLKLDQVEVQPVATKILDLAVNMGSRQAVKLLQSALNEMGADPRLKRDGKLGPKTRKAINSADPFELLSGFRMQATDFYTQLVKSREKLEPFLVGWLVRAAA